MRRCIEGEGQAFEQLMDRYESTVFNAVLRMVGDRDDAQETTQTVFVKALSNLDTFDPGYKFFSWLYRIAMNESLNLLGRRSHREIATEEATVGDRLVARDDHRATEASLDIQHALARIKPGPRKMIVLKHILGCSYRDMAAILELPEKTVKSRLFSAREQLRQALLGDSATHDR